MRASLLAVLASTLAGCFMIGGGGGNSRPAVTPMLSELPTDPEKRNAILDQAGQEPGPEHARRQLPGKQRKAETAAATAAAIIGSMFSKTQNVTIGTQSTFEENHLVAPVPVQPRAKAQGDGEATAPAQAEPVDGGQLVPWVKLKD